VQKSWEGRGRIRKEKREKREWEKTSTGRSKSELGNTKSEVGNILLGALNWGTFFLVPWTGSFQTVACRTRNGSS
jgi:hypothetical protein